MSVVRPALALALLPLWLLATMHCRIEAATGLPWLACAEAEHVAGDDCHADDCATIEDNLYRPGHESFRLPPPACAAGIFAFFAAAPQFRLGEKLPALRPSTTVPPEFEPCWSFVRRAAPRARAPASNA